uniref:Uncharacterized protein n=1 Tax=Nelumbo nucifera TaxID=4432 RepID=A0A822XF93_NELNU|nr:TPA_asm: hypothetical protein HUJ06_020330 [Nelumbo nucifera]
MDVYIPEEYVICRRKEKKEAADALKMVSDSGPTVVKVDKGKQKQQLRQSSSLRLGKEFLVSGVVSEEVTSTTIIL